MTNSSDARPPAARYVVVVNGESGSSDADTVDRVCDHLARSGQVDRRETSAPDDLDRVLEELDDRVLVVAGGDGSIHAAVARAHHLGVLGGVTFGLVPLGTGNDLARTVGIPLDAKEAAQVVVDGAPRRLDLITFGDGEVAVNALHAGIGADAAERAEPLKQRIGVAAYPAGAVAAGVSAAGWDLRVEVDDETLATAEGERVLMVAIGNGRTIGGGTEVCPDADPADGALDVVVSRATGPAARAAYATALVRGTHLDRDDVASRRGASVVVHGTAPYNVDGELIGERTDARFEVVPSAWTLRVPR